MKNKRLIFATTTLSIVLLAIVSLIALTFVRSMYIQATLLRKIETQYGGYISGQYVTINHDHIEVLTLGPLTHGGVFQRSGVLDGDIVVGPVGDITSFLLLLDVPAGTIIYLDVVDGGNGPPLSSRPMRQIILVSP